MSATESTVVKQSAVARNGLFILLDAAAAAAFVRGVPNAATTAGAIAAGVFTTAAAIGVTLLWFRASQLRSQLSISSEAIALQLQDHRAVSAIWRRDGEHLRFVMRGGYRYRNLVLEQLETSAAITLPWYSKKPIMRACIAHGWQVAGAPAPQPGAQADGR